MANHESCVGIPAFCWLVIHTYSGEHPVDRRGVWPRGTQGNTCQGDTALFPKDPVLETKSSGVKWFGWVESIQIYKRSSTLVIYTNLYVPMLLPCSVLMHTACPGLPLRSRRYI